MTTEEETPPLRIGRLPERGGDMLAARPSRWFPLVALFLAVQVGPWWYTSPDSSCYLSIARSFSRDDGPRNLGNRFLFYPPGYPLLLAPTFAFGDRPFAAI